MKFIPYARGAELRDQLRSLDLFVLPSHQEGLCIAALEAMACGCPVVSTRCGGPEEFVIDGETGILVGFDPEEMAAAMLKVLGDRKLHARLAQGARDRVLRHYSIVKRRIDFLACIRRVLPGTGSSKTSQAGCEFLAGGELIGMID